MRRPLATLLLLVACLHAQQERDQVAWEEGRLPLILTAPHAGGPSLAIAGVPERNGEGVEQFNLLWDTHTDRVLQAAAAELERRTGQRPFVVYARFSRRSCDANRPPEQAYEHEAARPCYERYHGRIRAAVAEVREGWEHALLVDIHGQGKRPGHIWRGTRDGRTVPGLRAGEDLLEGARGLLTALRERGFATWPPSWEEPERPYNGGYTVATYGGHADGGVDALQLELGRDLRVPRERAVATGTALGAALADWLEAHERHFRAR